MCFVDFLMKIGDGCGNSGGVMGKIIVDCNVVDFFMYFYVVFDIDEVGE